MSELPRGWANATVQELCNIQTGKKDVNQGNPKGKYYFFTCASEPLRSDNYIYDGESILLPGNGANVGLVLYYKGKFDLYQRTYALTNFLIYGKYLYYYLLGNWKTSLIDKQYGSATNFIRLNNIAKLNVPLAPINEQRRIVSKLEKLLAKVNATQERLEKIPTILKRFRRSVLAAACSGRLTENWRSQHPDVEPAEELLKRIQKHNGKQNNINVLNKDSSKIPNQWIVVKFGQIISEMKNGISQRPNIEPPGIPILRISAVRNGNIDLSDIRYLSNADKFLPDYILKEKDLLFTRYNGSIDLLGVCGMVKNIEEKIFLYPDKLIRVRINNTFINTKYAEIYFQSPAVRASVIAKSKSSAGQNGISGMDIKNQLFLIPPVIEQQEIVRRVEALFKKADVIEQRYLKAKAYLDKLTQSILAKAFRGELVPQDPNDEPAEVLLDRIRSEKAQAFKGTKPKTQSRKKLDTECVTTFLEC